jgi:Spy/CpxP family protein refolding chaperone
MKKLWIVIAAALLALGMMAMAQNKSKSGNNQQAPAPDAQQGMTQNPGEQSDLMADADEAEDFDVEDDQPDMAPNFGQPGGGQMMGMGMNRPGMGGPGRGMRRGMPFGGDRMAMIMEMADKLELTDAQKAQFEKLRTDFQLSQVDRRADLEKAQIRLHELMRNDKSAEADVLKGIDEVARIRTDMAKSRFSHMRQMRGVLTDKQLETLKTLRHDQMQSRMQGRPGCAMGADGKQQETPNQHRGSGK